MGELTLLCFLECRKYISLVKGALLAPDGGRARIDTQLPDEGIQRQRAYINKTYYFFTDLLPYAILLFRFLTNQHPNLNFFALSNLHKFGASLSKKYNKLPILIISLMIIYDLHAHMKSIFLLVIWSCVDVMICPAIRTQKV